MIVTKYPMALLHALEQGCLFYRVNGEDYAAERITNTLYACWRLDDTQQFEVRVDLRLCACRELKCPHVRAVCFGGDTDHIPWPETRLQKRRRVVR